MNRLARRAAASGNRDEINVGLTLAPATVGAVTLDAQECRDVEDWATDFVESTGMPLPIGAEKYAVFKARGINMSLFRVTG